MGSEIKWKQLYTESVLFLTPALLVLNVWNLFYFQYRYMPIKSISLLISRYWKNNHQGPIVQRHSKVLFGYLSGKS